MHTNYKSLDY